MPFVSQGGKAVDRTCQSLQGGGASGGLREQVTGQGSWGHRALVKQQMN